MTKGIQPPSLPENVPKEGEVYKHYKGDPYEVIGLALHSNDDIWMVVYKPLYEPRDAEMFTRPLMDWDEDVEWEEKIVKRFTINKNN